MISYILPYMYNPERQKLLDICLSRIFKYKAPEDEVLLHEVGECARFKSEYPVNYTFTEYTGVFHKAWVINKLVKQKAKGDKLALVDCDFYLPESWFRKVETFDLSGVGWNKLVKMTPESTERLVSSGEFDPVPLDGIIHQPKLLGASGGVNVVDVELFMEIKGFPEDFQGSWGGEDNAFLHKLKSFCGGCVHCMDATLYHMYHEHRTVKIQHIRDKIHTMKHWTKKDWIKHIDKIGDNWGI